MPFGLTLYVDGMKDCRVSACCEYRHHTGKLLGSKTAHFGLVKVEGGRPCYRCQAAEEKAKEEEEEEEMGGTTSERGSRKLMLVGGGGSLYGSQSLGEEEVVERRRPEVGEATAMEESQQPKVCAN